MQSTDAQSILGTTGSHLERFTVQSSDVLSDMRINILKEGSETVIWYKERFLADEEIIDHVVENATSGIQWSIHRPKRGWYIRLRSPAFPPGSYVNLAPLLPTSPYHSEAALSFGCRTNPPPVYLSPVTDSSRSLDSEVTLTETNLHSYPPTPPPQNPTVRVQPPSPQSIHARLTHVPLPAEHITQFVLTPHSNAHAPTAQPSLFARVMSVIKNSAPSHSFSFTLSPLPPSGTQPPQGSVVPTPIPLLTYHDRTPVWTVGSTYGVIEIDKQRELQLGVQTSFYVAVALTYLDFLMERESYIAAAAD